VEVAERPAGKVAFADIKPGMEFQGKVTKIELFGAFVDIGAERDGLVHISMLRKERVNRVEDVVSTEQPVQVWVQSVDPNSHRLELTMIRPVLLKWNDIKPGLRVKGTVVKIEKFGAFVDVGAERPGLVHVSEMSDDYVTNASDVVKEGEQVEAVVIDSDRSKRQIRLSMKQAAVLPAEEVEEEAPIPSAMEIALRRAMEGTEAAAPSKPVPTQAISRPTRKTQEDILARTLKERIK
jgi:small subunit ribosomal protein S1